MRVDTKFCTEPRPSYRPTQTSPQIRLHAPDRLVDPYGGVPLIIGSQWKRDMMSHSPFYPKSPHCWTNPVRLAQITFRTAQVRSRSERERLRATNDTDFPTSLHSPRNVLWVESHFLCAKTDCCQKRRTKAMGVCGFQSTSCECTLFNSQKRFSQFLEPHEKKEPGICSKSTDRVTFLRCFPIHSQSNPCGTKNIWSEAIFVTSSSKA